MCVRAPPSKIEHFGHQRACVGGPVSKLGAKTNRRHRPLPCEGAKAAAFCRGLRSRVWRVWRRCNVLLSECILAEHTALKRRSQRVEDSSQRKLLLIALNRPTIQTPPKQLTPLTAFGATTFYVCAQGGLSSVCARCERLESREHDANESPWLTVASVDSVLSARARQTRAMAPGGLERKVGWCSRVAQV